MIDFVKKTWLAGKYEPFETEAYLKKYQFQLNFSLGNFFYVIIENDGADFNYDFELSSQCLGHRYNLPTNLLGYTVFVSLFKPQNESNMQNDGICLPNGECHSSFLTALPFLCLLESAVHFSNIVPFCTWYVSLTFINHSSLYNS